MEWRKTRIIEEASGMLLHAEKNKDGGGHR
jgi:hypothetical protein